MTDTDGTQHDEHRIAKHGVEEHDHAVEGDEHETVQHGDHVDHVHDGHRHARHDDHYDEH